MLKLSKFSSINQWILIEKKWYFFNCSECFILTWDLIWQKKRHLGHSIRIKYIQIISLTWKRSRHWMQITAAFSHYSPNYVCIGLCSRVKIKRDEKVCWKNIFVAHIFFLFFSLKSHPGKTIRPFEWCTFWVLHSAYSERILLLATNECLSFFNLHST